MMQHIPPATLPIQTLLGKKISINSLFVSSGYGRRENMDQPISQYTVSMHVGGGGFFGLGAAKINPSNGHLCPQRPAALITDYSTYIASRNQCSCTFGGAEAASDGNK